MVLKVAEAERTARPGDLWTLSAGIEFLQILWMWLPTKENIAHDEKIQDESTVHVLYNVVDHLHF